MTKANQELKAYARSKKVAYWQIAKAFNVHENTCLLYTSDAADD